jgi:hypothetical protein
VLVLAITFDADLLQLLRHRAALAALAASAAAARVQLLPVLLVEGQESLLSVPAADLKAAGLHVIAAQQQQQQGLLDIDDAAAQLAAALHLPSLPLLRLSVGTLLSSSSSSGGGDLDASALLGSVGGLEQQQQLLLALQRLEGQLAGLLQARHSSSMGLGLQAKL